MLTPHEFGEETAKKSPILGCLFVIIFLFVFLVLPFLFTLIVVIIDMF